MAECIEIIQQRKSLLQHPVFKFTYVNGIDEICCKACKHKFPGPHAGNIRKHIQSKHKTDFIKLEQLIEEYNNSSNVNVNKSSAALRTRRGKNTENSVTVSLDIAEVKSGLVEMCSVDMCSFELLRNPGFLRIIAPIIRESRKSNIPLSTRPEALHAYSDDEYLKMRNIIKNELKGKIFSVLADATTTQNRSIFGILAQYFQNDQLVVRTLAMRRLMDDPSGINLSTVVKNVLFEYGVNAAYVYSMTTDNESAVQKCIRDTSVIVLHNCITFEAPNRKLLFSFHYFLNL